MASANCWHLPERHPMIRTHAKSLLLCAAAFTASAAPALAQGLPGTWRGHGGEDRYEARNQGRQTAKPSRKIEVTAFRAADAGERLGKGRIVVGRPATAADDTGGKLPVYEAAVIDELARRGYDTANAADPGQIAEIGVSHSVAMPEEAPHKKVSGASSGMATL
jgi:hypothetical protein